MRALRSQRRTNFALRQWVRLAGSLILGWSLGATPPSVDGNALPAWFAIQEQLAQDREPTAVQWESLFALPGYQAIRHEFSPESMKERFRVALMPALQDRAASILRAGGKDAALVLHYRQVQARRAELMSWVSTANLGARAAVANTRSVQWLTPRPFIRQPAVAIIIFAPDARGYDPVVVDGLLALTLGQRLDDVLAHEFFHIHRADRMRERTPFKGPPILEQIQNEGIADLIDKQQLFQLPASRLEGRERRFTELVQETPAVIQAMDRILSNPGPPTPEALHQELRQVIPQSGHPTGYYMAQAILHSFGPSAIEAVAIDVVAFFQRYQAAACRPSAPYPAFSPAALKRLCGDRP